MKQNVLKFVLLLVACVMSYVANAQSQDIYYTGRIDTLMLKSKYFDFDRKVFVRLPEVYDVYDAMDFDVVYTVDAQTMEQFYMECAWPIFINPSGKRYIVVGICSPQEETYSRQDDFLPADSATIKSYGGHGGHAADLANFVKNELQPYIRSHYRTTEHSLGIGHSLGASFMLQCLMSNDPFTDYFFLSPNLTFGKDKLMRATQFVNYTFDKNKKRYLFFCDAGEERIHGWSSWKPARDMVYQYLDGQHLPSNVTWTRKFYLDYNHWTSFPYALHDAYQGYFKYLQSVDSVMSSEKAVLSKKKYRKHIELVVQDAKQEVYITGNQEALGSWNPAKVKLKHVNDSIRAIDVDLHLPVQFKFTLGNWDYEAYFDNSSSGANLEINSCQRQSYRFVLDEWVKQ